MFMSVDKDWPEHRKQFHDEELANTDNENVLYRFASILPMNASLSALVFSILLPLQIDGILAGPLGLFLIPIDYFVGVAVLIVVSNVQDMSERHNCESIALSVALPLFVIVPSVAFAVTLHLWAADIIHSLTLSFIPFFLLLLESYCFSCAPCALG
eukprot:TRINITY_DN5058_c0_g1_i1.p1 TRINITY_DN5058_c0_g1~~TRINITY_DN5058_c0_g1_i1.p1  ORF type:complete len:156 (-),score=44.49 TRINITY_DN5058_c0_g1_i1:50-517(-)